MPIYEYKCMDCGNKFEKLLKISEADKKIQCPKCQGENTKKAFSVFGKQGSSIDIPSCPSAPSCGRSGFG